MKTMAGHYTMLEALSFQVIFRSREGVVELEGSRNGRRDRICIPRAGGGAGRTWVVCIKTGLFYHNVSISRCGVTGLSSLREDITKWSDSEELQSLPDVYLSHNSKLESVAFN